MIPRVVCQFLQGVEGRVVHPLGGVKQVVTDCAESVAA